MKDKDRPSRIMGRLNGAVYVLFAVLAAAIVIFMNFEAGVLLEFFLIFVAALIAMTLWLKRQLSTLPETGEEVQPAGAEAAALLEGARAVLRYREFEPTARAIFDICKELTGATAGYVALMSADGSENEVLFLDAGGRACHVNPDLPMPIRGLRGEAYAKGKAVYENDFGNSPWIKYIPSDHVKLDNILFAPLILEEKVVGVIGLANKPGRFDENDARLAAAFGEIASIGLANSQMLESLEQSESRFRGMYDSNMIGIAFCKQAGEVTDANDAFLEMVGYTRQDVREGKVNWVEMTPPEYEHLRQKGVEEAEAKGYCTPFEKEYIRKDGTRVPILVGGALLNEKEGFGVAYAIDITERKRAEKMLKESEERIRLLFETMPHAVYECDTAGVITVANSAYSRITGYSNDELVGMHIWDMMEQGEQKESLPGYLRQLVAEQSEPSPYVCRNVTKAGRLIDVEVNWDYKRNHQGQVTAFVCILSDVTDLHEAEAALYWESSVNKALAHLSNVLNKPHFSFEEISDFVLAHAKRMTGSKFGFAGYVDEQTGYLVCPTLMKDVWKRCNVQGKDIVLKKCGGLCGRVLNERESVLANSLREDPRSSGMPQGHIPIERFIGVPSVVGDEVIGMVAIANADRDYVERDLWLVERLAEIYALAIQSNRSQRRLEKHDSQLRDLVSSLGLAHERRARKLAAGLHEEIIDRLASTRQSMASLDKVEGKGRSADSMPRVREALQDLVETTHAFASKLSCPVLRQSGLEAAVENWLAEDIRRKHGIETVFEKDDNCRVADEDVEHFLFEAIKELLANTVEHARATRVKVSLKRSGDDVEVAIADDGIGFDTAGTMLKPGEGIEYNLFCIGERLRHLGGDMEIDSRLGEGTRVVLTVPAGSGVRK